MPDTRGDRTPLRIVVLSPSIPHTHVEHAGGRYLVALDKAWRELGEPVWCAPDVPSNRESITRPGTPGQVFLRGRARTRSLRDRLVVVLLERLWRRLNALDATFPPIVFCYGVLTDPATRALVREADVIDLQWSEYLRLAPLLRRLNPEARFVGTFHDVLSQRWSRYAEIWEPGFQRWVWRFSAAVARRSERAALRRFDDLIVFSDKDRDLLGGEGATPIHVIPPPLTEAGAQAPAYAPAGQAHVIFVGFWRRWENNDAALWLVTELWPQVLARVPHARLSLVGAAASEELAAAVAEAPQVELTGFVDDLEEVYRTADVTVVPLRIGAGVKFKTVESILAGVPTVTTPVGREGIGEEDWFHTVAADGEGLVDGLVSALTDPAEARRTAERTRALAEQVFGVEAFTATVAQTYRRRS